MVNLLGALLPDRKLIKIALLAYHGISHKTSSSIMARLQFHDQLRVQDLTEGQLNALSALLSAPAAAPRPLTPLRPFLFPSSSSSSSSLPSASTSSTTPTTSTPTIDAAVLEEELKRNDPITTLIIEEDLKRQTRANIAHHRTIGTLTGRQHAMGLPVRGQKNRTNGKTAKRLNRIERRGCCTSSRAGARTSPVLESLKSLHISTGRPSMFRSL